MAFEQVLAERASDADLAAAIGELQRVRHSIVDGAAADANIAVAGIAVADTLAAVIRLPRTRRAVADGAAANADIAIGAAAGDRILSVLEVLPPDAGAGPTLVDRTGVSVLDAGGALNVNDDTTGNQVDVLFEKPQANLLAEAAITGAGNIQLADTVTTGDRLLVVWFDKAA